MLFLVNKKGLIGEVMPDYTRQPLLSPEIEDRLKTEMKPLWDAGLYGGQIATILEFGIPGTAYAKVKPNYVYFYRQKFEKEFQEEKSPISFPIRQPPRFAKDAERYADLRATRYKKIPEEFGVLMPEEFVEELNKKLPLPAQHRYTECARAYLILHYWSPLRESELFERLRKDFEITKDEIIIHLLRKKKGHKPGDKDEPNMIRREWNLVEEAVGWLERFDEDERPFNFEAETARNYVRTVFEGRYPHYFRFSWISDKIDDLPNTTMREIAGKTYLTISAVERYIMKGKRLQKKIDDRTTERLKARTKK